MKFEVTFEIEKDDQMIVLTAEEARDLYNRLKKHFGEEPPYNPITIPYYPIQPQPPFIPWSSPTTGDPLPPQPWTITCSYEKQSLS